MLYKIVKVMLDPITRSKVFIVTQKEQKAVLGDLMDPEDLPEQYGEGTHVLMQECIFSHAQPTSHPQNKLSCRWIVSL